MILASAQIKTKEGDVNYNLNKHYQIIDQAHVQKAELVLFPEMSLTGYMREEAHEHKFIENDSRLIHLKRLSASYNMILIVGAPIQLKNQLYIGAFIILPDGETKIYTKQYLHEGEELFFRSSFKYNPLIKIGSEQIAIAICADIMHSVHAQKASEAGATIYLASIFFTLNGIQEGHCRLQQYSHNHKMKVLMSNNCGQAFGLDAGGRSAFWNGGGELGGELQSIDEGLLLAKKDSNIWKTEHHIIKPLNH